jgi:cytoskeletal protein RodZ
MNKRFPAGAVVAAAVIVGLLGAGAALAISASSQQHNTPTVTVKERTVEKTAPPASTPTPAHTTSTPSNTSRPATTPAAPAGPSLSEREAHAVAAVDSYWGDIENHDFSGAYEIEEPSAGSSESEWVQAEEKEGVERISYSFEPGSLEGNEATVNVGSLQTVARKTGCYTWTGYYRLTDYSGTWKITHDGLERHSC